VNEFFSHVTIQGVIVGVVIALLFAAVVTRARPPK